MTTIKLKRCAGAAIKDINPSMIELSSVIDLRRWTKEEVRRRSDDNNFKFTQFDLLGELLTEETNLMFRYRRAFNDEKWRRTLPFREGETTPEETKARLEFIRDRMLENGYNASIFNSSESDQCSRHLTIQMKNTTVELYAAFTGNLRARLPYHYIPTAHFSNQTLSPGAVPYTDEQLIDVLSLLDEVIPDIESDIHKGVTEYRAKKTAQKIIDISDSAIVRGIMDETGLQYSATMTSRGMRVRIPVGERNTLSFRIRKNGCDLDAEKVLAAVEAIRKAAETFGPGMLVEPKM